MVCAFARPLVLLWFSMGRRNLMFRILLLTPLVCAFARPLVLLRWFSRGLGELVKQASFILVLGNWRQKLGDDRNGCSRHDTDVRQLSSALRLW